MFYDLLSIFTLPFQNEYFIFRPRFFIKIGDLAERFSKSTDLKKYLITIEAQNTSFT